MALHNYIRDTKLPDKEFDRRDAVGNYMSMVVRRAAPIPHGRAPSSPDTVNMKDIRERDCRFVVLGGRRRISIFFHIVRNP
jgi:hypothetical protein